MSVLKSLCLFCGTTLPPSFLPCGNTWGDPGRLSLIQAIPRPAHLDHRLPGTLDLAGDPPDPSSAVIFMVEKRWPGEKVSCQDHAVDVSADSFRDLLSAYRAPVLCHIVEDKAVNKKTKFPTLVELKTEGLILPQLFSLSF